MIFIMRIEILTVQFWHLHRVIRKGLTTWKCKYPIYLGDIFSWGLLWNVQQLSDLLLFACCSYVHDLLAFIYFLNVISTLASIQETAQCVIWLVSFRYLVTMHHIFYICIEEDLQVWFVVYWITENSKCFKAGVTRKTMDFNRGCWKQRVPCVLYPK